MGLFLHLARNQAVPVYIQFSSQLKLRVDWHSLALQYKITQTFFVCKCFGAEAFYLVFCLLVALSIMSGDLKLCQECVIVKFKTSFLTVGNTANVLSFFFFFNWLLAQT